jgi:glycosyltransferase involved in cell wall biosynthesis
VRPRILCLMQLPPPIHGAAVVNQQIATSELLNEHFELDIIELRFAHSLASLGRPSVMKIAKAIGVAGQLALRLLRRHPDGVYITFSPTGVSFYRDCVFVAIVKAFGVPRLYHLHTKGIAPQLQNRWKNALYRWAFSRADVVVLSPLLRADLSELVPVHQIHFVANGLPDLPSPQRREAGPVRILFLSHLIRAKGPLVLLQALGLLHARGIDFHATFAGAAARDGCTEELMSRARALKLEDKIRYIGEVSGREKDELWANHDVFAFPTLHEAFGLVLLEAMRAELPVVTSDEGSAREIVGAGGIVVPPGDADALAQALARLIRDPALRSVLGANGRVRYLETYTQREFEQRMLRTFEAWLGVQGPKANSTQETHDD